MSTSSNEQSISPDGQHKILFHYHDEMRFGPIFYRISVDHMALGNRLFAGTCKWSADSRIAALTEYQCIDFHSGEANAALLLIRFPELTCSKFPTVENGHASAQQFYGRSYRLIHVDQIFGEGRKTITRETDTDKIDDWIRLTPNGNDPIM